MKAREDPWKKVRGNQFSRDRASFYERARGLRGSVRNTNRQGVTAPLIQVINDSLCRVARFHGAH